MYISMSSWLLTAYVARSRSQLGTRTVHVARGSWRVVGTGPATAHTRDADGRSMADALESHIDYSTIALYAAAPM